MSEDENKTKKQDKILKIVKEILDFNKRTRKQQGLGLEILTPNQILRCMLKMKLGKFCILCTDQKTYKATLQRFG